MPPPVVEEASREDTHCFEVFQQSHPFLDTEGGDVHAGTQFASAPCLLDSSDPNYTAPRTITGTTDGGSIGSKADYILSASGTVVDSGSGSLRRRFGSGRGANFNDVTFGNDSPLGHYGEVCRSDLAAELDDGGVASPGIISAASIPNNAVTVYNGNLTISGGNLSNGQQKTVVVKGNVYISNSITRSTSGYTNKNAIPSFAVITTGNIYIAPGVTEIYGVYYAGTKTNRGIINTCSNSSGSGPSIVANANNCSNPLTVNGMLMASEIVLRRTSSGVDSFTTRQPAEQVTFQPGLLLNAPPGLSNLLTQFDFGGELPPVY